MQNPLAYILSRRVDLTGGYHKRSFVTIARVTDEKPTCRTDLSTLLFARSNPWVGSHEINPYQANRAKASPNLPALRNSGYSPSS